MHAGAEVTNLGQRFRDQPQPGLALLQPSSVYWKPRGFS
jgi:hypothetical protein